MLTLGAFGFLLVSVFGSYLVSGGSIEVLAEALPFEMWTIGGAAIGSFVMANSMHELKHSVGKFKKIFSGAAYRKSDYVDLLSLLYYLVRLASTKGNMALEPPIENPGDSSAFQKFPQSPTRILNRTSKSSCEQQDGSGIEEGCCRLERSFEVLGEAAVAPEPGQEAFDHPAPGMHGKADLASLLAHDLDDDSGRGRHSVGGIGAIGEDPLDEGVQRARSLQQGNGAIAILDRGRMDLEYQPSAIGIDHGFTFAPVDLLAGVIAPRSTGFRGFDALAVDNRRTGAGFAADTFAIQHHQVVVQILPGSVIAKSGEPAIGRLMRREMLRQHAPRAAAAQHKEQRVHQFAHWPRPTAASLGRGRQQRREELPFCIGQITWVAQIVPVMLCPGLGGPHRRLQEWGSAQIPWNCRDSSPPWRFRDSL